MNKISIELENCYGIRALSAELDFTQQRAYAIYAPNGAMKSSLAQTFKDVADAVPSKDRIFPARKTTRAITDHSGAAISGDSVVVIRPYDESLGPTEKTSTLLVDAKLRAEYEQLYEEIDKAKATLLKSLKDQSGSKKDLEKEISSTFTRSEDNFFVALLRVREELNAQTDAPFADVPYDTIFDDKVVALIGTKDFKTAIGDYVKKYNELLDASTYFNRRTFNYYNAATIAKSLADNGFFEAKHSVRLNADATLEITSEKQLEELIQKEKEQISSDAELRKKYTEIEKLITKNIDVRNFHAYLAEHEGLLAELANIGNFKESVWKSYLKAHMNLYEDVITSFQAAEARRREIEQEAAGQRTQWETVIGIFNDRFFVPFKLEAKNRVQVVLGQEPVLSLGFIFEDGGERAEVDRKSLLEVLSTGEKKALYILNILFEIETRKSGSQETIFVIDDIADSFDYRNKYAIIQYLKDISEQPNFRQIILTHNFDFFRTVNSRFIGYEHCLMAVKSDTALALVQATGIKNPFVNDWKLNFFLDRKKRIASIPFIRNIVEYTKGDQEASFTKLTSLLHWKSDSAAMTEGDLDELYNSIFGTQGAWATPADLVVEGIGHEAAACLTADASINFENKIVLSIAIRLEAERFMVDRINDPSFASGISTNQTAALFARFRELPSSDTNAVATLQSVLLMTPENIHLNSFMYEPILDMSDDHLRKLYREVLTLSGGVIS